MKVISTPKDLAGFRSQWDGEAMLDLLRQHGGKLLVNLEVGVGKSSNIDQTTEEAIKSGSHDLVIALFPTRQIIHERKWVITPPSDIRIVNLRPRPASECGRYLNRRWRVFEKNALGALGRIELCGQCKNGSDCPWPRQFGQSLEGTQVIFGTQAHLERTPFFLNQLVQWTNAEKVLVILDESNLILKPFRRLIEHRKLKEHTEVLAGMNPRYGRNLHKKWRYLCELLLVAPTVDLRSNDWRMPWLNWDWSVAVQKKGCSIFGDSFRFLGYDLVHFGRSPLESRERVENGDIIFASVPNVNVDIVIYSGTTSQRFTEFRLGHEFTSPFDNYTFIHHETTWFNVASRLGMRTYFKKNSAQILDFFVRLIVRRLNEGKRVLLIAKKYFEVFCAKEIECRLKELRITAQVVTGNWTADELANPNVIPLIHYGIIGTNLFEEFDCAFCLTGFYVNEEAINSILQDVVGSDMNIPLKISTEGRPCRRKAGVLNRKDQIYDLHTLAQLALDHQEMDTVLQAVGRVRPYTKPREVITFQCAAHPSLEYTKEFTSIGEARSYFDIPSRKAERKSKIISKVQQARDSGLKQREASEKLGVSLRTIQRYWNEKPATLPL
jgi:hypothetical protein